PSHRPLFALHRPLGDWMHTQPWRMIEIDGLKYVWHDGDRAELFDLRTDPYEQTNLADEPTRSADRLRLHKDLVGMMRDLDDPLAQAAAAAT
ncbi:MAG: hypothetical protein AAGG79_05530, partial [Pseudomonadota bacterium]